MPGRSSSFSRTPARNLSGSFKSSCTWSMSFVRIFRAMCEALLFLLLFFLVLVLSPPCLLCLCPLPIATCGAAGPADPSGG
eukprot:CAMPEP_0203942690 /NCGR_PEP_ID=MMETSP0359-20131031/78824_1 /ASSEMBLY_ACC=CAM_ASM_000338 /TAXON_ID=268821 /ORGANISM="Scrippsiella Hangoei, Strain SHTV-5" /LENGTH=80 /DNA_ID=CAMNT_0050873431 /DNA_START=204 /DNA_END=443 /DNA_ORIENTATION=+